MDNVQAYIAILPSRKGGENQYDTCVFLWEQKLRVRVEIPSTVQTLLQKKYMIDLNKKLNQ